MIEPMLPVTGPLTLQRQAIEAATQSIERTAAVDEAVEVIRDVDVGSSPSEIVYRQNKLTLHRYSPPPSVETQERPILIVYALINRPYILDLQPDRSVVQRLLSHGFEVYLIDWGEPSRLDTTLTLEDYIMRYLDNCVDVVQERHDGQSPHFLGYCMGGTMSAIYAALKPEKVHTLGLMATGIRFDSTGGVLELWSDEGKFAPKRITDTFGNVPAPFLDIGFAMMDPVQNFIGKYARLYDNLENEEFLANFARMEKWLADGIDVAGETFVEFIEEFYQQDSLYQGSYMLGEHAVDLTAIDMPTLLIVGEYDHLVPADATIPISDLVETDDTKVFEMSTGHIGLSVSSRSHEDLWPRVCTWYAERNEKTRPETILQSISGIGPTYAQRLVSAEYTSLDDLVRAGPKAVAEAAGVGDDRAKQWLDQIETSKMGS